MSIEAKVRRWLKADSGEFEFENLIPRFARSFTILAVVVTGETLLVVLVQR